MKEIHYFIAEDGQKFKNEKECIEHEFQITTLPKLANCQAFDFSLAPIELNSENLLCDPDYAGSIYYIYIGDKAGFDTFSELYHNLGYRCPADTRDFNGPIFLHYNDDDEWEDLEEIIHYYQDRIEMMKNAL